MGMKKKMRRIENKKRKDYDARLELIRDDLKNLTKKYRIDLVPIIRVVESGVHPLIAFVDATEAYAKQEAEEKAKKVAKPKLEV